MARSTNRRSRASNLTARNTPVSPFAFAAKRTRTANGADTFDVRMCG
jgi:hypothetical protein